jgi:AraC family transcriptional regulator
MHQVLVTARDPAEDTQVSTRTTLLNVSVGLVEDVRSPGASSWTRAEHFSPDFQLAFPYRGFFIWHVGRDEVVGDVNQVLFVTSGEAYRLSHPVAGGFAELVVTPSPCVLAELAHAAGLMIATLRTHPLFRRRSSRLTPRLQSVRARFGAWARHPMEIDTLAAEELVLALLRSTLTETVAIARPAGSTQRLIRRTKIFLESHLTKPIRLAGVSRAVGASPIYLTQVFRDVEGVPLHRYLTQLRLARALAELPHTTDITRLALDLGFSSHSHFSATFHRTFGVTPSQFRRHACGIAVGPARGLSAWSRRDSYAPGA